MPAERLHIYLNDHLALLVGELEVAKRCRSENQQTPLASFLDHLAADLRDQQNILRDCLQRIGGTESRTKQGAAWIGEKLGRLKLNDSLISYSPLSRVIELEGLAATALERVCLWETLDQVSQGEARLHGIAFDHLCDQSRQHLDELLTRRRFAADQAFRVWTSGEE